MNLILILFALIFGDNASIKTSMAYEPIPESNELFLQLPFSIAFSSNSDLFVLDTLAKKVHVWSSLGKYLQSFGRIGMGPGEMARPETLDILNDRLWLYDHSGRRLTQFSLQGEPLQTISSQVRANRFAALRDDLFVAGYKKHHDKERTQASFELIDGNGRVVKILKQFDHGGYLKRDQGKTRIKAFGPEMDIQRISAKRWLFGFSQENVLYEIDDSGEIVASHVIEMFTEKPSDFDKDLIKTLSFPNSAGTRTGFSDWRHLELSFEHDKAYYTHFTKPTENKLVFALTPLGGFGTVAGFHRATYFVSDLKTKKMVARGYYELPEDSLVFYKAGRVIVFEVTDDGSYAIKSITLKGS